MKHKNAHLALFNLSKSNRSASTGSPRKRSAASDTVKKQAILKRRAAYLERLRDGNIGISRRIEDDEKSAGDGKKSPDKKSGVHPSVSHPFGGKHGGSGGGSLVQSLYAIVFRSR